MKSPGETVPADASALGRARLALEGLSIGDAFGEQFFVSPTVVESLIEQRAMPAPPWHWTDDTAMGLSVYETLREHGGIERDSLARRFADRYRRDPRRGYGATAHDILNAISLGDPWREAARRPFDRQGSMGNGGGMRVAPIGGYFAENLDAAIEHARASAEPTHAHPDGQAGAIAVAVAAAIGWQIGNGLRSISADALLATVAAHTPPGATRDGIEKAMTLPLSYDPRTAVAALGNGSRVIASDTVPFSLWCAARHLDDFEEAMWTTVSGLGDRDTTCAIVGGIVALAVGQGGIPKAFLAAREPLDSALTPIAVVLYRPVGFEELELIGNSGFRRFPPRLPEQPIFYPVCNERYASEIAERWNATHSGAGFVTRFQVRADFLSGYETHVVGARYHEEYWIPANELELFNDAIVGTIEVVEEFRAIQEEAP